MTNPDTRTMSEFESDLDYVLTEMLGTLVAKRKAYGTTNLTRFGPLGIVIRASDKIDRLANRYREGTDAVGGMDTDTVEDSWRDLAGYALLGLMEHRRNQTKESE